MTSQLNAFVGCTVIGDYVDEGEVPANLVPQRGEVVCPQVVASYLDSWGRDDALNDFTILLRLGGSRDDVQTIKVRGYRLQKVSPGGVGVWLGILARPGERDIYTALFPGDSVVAAFCGETQLAE